MPRITLLMLPEPGHLLPTFRFAAKLKQRGYQIQYLSFPGFQDAIEPLGFEFTPVLANLSENSHDNGMFGSLRAGSSIYRSLIPHLLSQEKSLLREIFQDIAPLQSDLLIIDSRLVEIENVMLNSMRQRKPANILQELKCPVVRVNPSFTDTQYDVPRSDFYNRIPELVLCPKRFDLPDAPRTNHKCYFVEPSVFEMRQEIPFPWSWLDPQRRLVYCSFGTQSLGYKNLGQVLRHLVGIFAELNNFQLVLSVGAQFDAGELGVVPANVMVCAKAPQLEILKRASAIITHGGLGTLKESILMAVPMIVLPFDFDQPLNARRVTHHGLGYAFAPNSLVREQMRAALLDIVDNETIRAKLCNMQALFQQVEQAAPSILHIERFLTLARRPAPDTASTTVN